MTSEYAKRAREFMENNVYLHYIYGVRVITGVVINKYDFYETDEAFDKAATELLNDEWNSEILAIHLRRDGQGDYNGKING